ncbi:MAG TPA: carboxypeptidase-like regulatory domain-containing protein [Myxococcota bacterium]|nr:carboxypeptidase-like regulatory domain-containing protein [Myxococcota bacterium]HQK50581.1 carboxypeptidase-like regulatory domain-containing protein [Myxococcota bacterium]
MSRFLPVSIVAFMLAAVPRVALPCGPGVHVREARALLQRLAAGDPLWAQTAAIPNAEAYLALGSIAPDFQWAIPQFSFGHEFSLAYQLLDRGDEAGPEYRLFGLGFLSHVTASDPACEQFHAPTMMAAAGIGVVDLNGSDDGPKGEAEMLFESLGDLVLGDWDTLVETVWAFWFAGNEAKDRGREVFGWYCREASTFLGRATDCDGAWAHFTDLLGQAEGLLGGMSLEEMKDFAHSLIDQPLPGLMDLFLSGFLQQFLGDRFVPSANFEREKERFFRSPFAEDAFWAQYEGGLDQLGPSFAVDRLVLRNDGFPSWIDKPLFTGNIEGAMATLPGEFAVVPGLIFDGLEWWDDQGAPVRSLAPTDQGRSLTLWVRLYSARRIAGDLRVVVKGDRPGDDTTDDPVLAEEVLPLVMNPLNLVREPRFEVTVPFQADLEGVRGLYAEFYFQDSPLPCFSTNWDRVWRTGAFDFEQPATWDSFGTYGRWPPSLPVVGTDVEDPWVFVKVRVAPRGGGVDGAQVTLTDGEATREVVTGWNGIAVFPRTGLEPVTVAATAPGFGPADPVQVTPRNLESVWAEVFLHALPVFAAPTGSCIPDHRCIPFSMAPDPFQGQVSTFQVTAEGPGSPPAVGDPVEVSPGQAATACLPSDQPDGTPVRLLATPRYRDGTEGIEGTSRQFTLDTSAPQGHTPTLQPAVTCRGEAPIPRSWTISWKVIEPHSTLAEVAYRLEEDDWTPLSEDSWVLEAPGTWQVSFGLTTDAPPSGQVLHLQGRNCAGLETEASLTLPDWASLPPCAGPDLGPEEPPETGPTDDLAGPDVPRDVPADVPGIDQPAGPDEGADTSPPAEGGGGGCTASGRGHQTVVWVALAVLCGFGAARRRKPLW